MMNLTGLSSRAIQVLAAIAVLAAVSSGPVSACTACYCDSICSILGDCCPWCLSEQAGSGQIPGETVVTPLSGNLALIKVTGALTAGMESGDTCVTALQGAGGIVNVRSITLENALTGEAIYKFAANENSSRSFGALFAEHGYPGLPQAPVLGFRATVTNDVPDRIPTSTVLLVSYDKKLSFVEFVGLLREHGVVGGAAGEPDGTLNDHHFSIRQLKDMPFSVNVPADVDLRPSHSGRRN